MKNETVPTLLRMLNLSLPFLNPLEANTAIKGSRKRSLMVPDEYRQHRHSIVGDMHFILIILEVSFGWVPQHVIPPARRNSHQLS